MNIVSILDIFSRRVKISSYIIAILVLNLWRQDTIVQFVMTLIFVSVVTRRMDILIRWRNLVLILMGAEERRPPPAILRKRGNSVSRGVSRVWCTRVSVGTQIVVYLVA